MVGVNVAVIVLVGVIVGDGGGLVDVTVGVGVLVDVIVLVGVIVGDGGGLVDVTVGVGVGVIIGLLTTPPNVYPDNEQLIN